MGKNRQNIRTVDMAEKVEVREYRPPPLSSCKAVEYPIILGEGHSLVIVQRIYRGLIVYFAIMQLFEQDEARHNIARIDCCHGVVHRHVFDQQGNDLADRQVLKEIDAERDPWVTVDAEFEVSYERMMSEFMENYRRWSS